MGTETRGDETPTMPLIVVRVTAAATTVEEFIARFARYFRDGEIVFVPTEGVQPTGRRIRFVFALAGGEDLVTGEGVVLRMRRDSGDPRRPPGMELRYQILDDASQAMVERLLAARRTPPPYVSMRIDGVADSQQVTLPHPQIEPPLPLPPPLPPPPIVRASSPPPIPALPPAPAISSAPAPSPSLPPPRARLATLASVPALPPPDGTHRLRFVGVALATAAAMVAMALAMAIVRTASSRAVAVGGNGVVVDSNRAAVAGAPAVVAGGPAVVVPESASASVAPPVVTGPRPASTGGARPPPPPPPARGGSRPIELRVTTSPPGALVFIDGQQRGSSPLTVAVVAGAHDIVAERPRWSSAHAHVDRAGRVQLVLERPPAHLHIASTPPGAGVRLDGRDVGVTPLDVDTEAYELHRVRLELEGRVWRRKIYLRPPGGAVHVGPGARSVDEPGAIRVANDLGKRVRP